MRGVGYVVLLLMCLTSFVVLAAYAGNLTAFMAIPQTEKPIDTLDDLIRNIDTIPTVFVGNSLNRFIEVGKR